MSRKWIWAGLSIVGMWVAVRLGRRDCPDEPADSFDPDPRAQALSVAS